ncbi:hypothetical protein [Zooshikella ganghwensis]|nr:hypothetical protein [Zooshikella ganghwensis]RDH41230.1 hypothetical protein B9G39_29400 [Zooshikella ganghwensis]RDH41301.1 hypothetical protein B9G39_28955 [Zooshikella ganghwensis]
MGSTNINDHNIQISVKGDFLKAWQACHNDFMSIDDLTKEQKDLSQYTVTFSEEDSNYIILFEAKLLTSEQAKKYNRIALGRDTKYVVNKESFKIVERIFYK